MNATGVTLHNMYGAGVWRSEAGWTKQKEKPADERGWMRMSSSPESQTGSRNFMSLGGVVPRFFHGDPTYRVRFLKQYLISSLPDYLLSANLRVFCGHRFVETQEW